MTSVFYGNLADALDYHTERGNIVWLAADDDDQTAALLIASEYIDNNFRTAFPGVKVGFRDQEREWPRNGAMDWLGYAILPPTIPIEILNATYEIALRQISKPGSLNVDFIQAKNVVSVRVESAVDVTYSGVFDAQSAQVVMLNVQEILQPILVGNDYIALTSPLGGKSVRG